MGLRRVKRWERKDATGVLVKAVLRPRGTDRTENKSTDRGPPLGGETGKRHREAPSSCTAAAFKQCASLAAKTMAPPSILRLDICLTK